MRTTRRAGHRESFGRDVTRKRASSSPRAIRKSNRNWPSNRKSQSHRQHGLVVGPFDYDPLDTVTKTSATARAIFDWYLSLWVDRSSWAVNLDLPDQDPPPNRPPDPPKQD